MKKKFFITSVTAVLLLGFGMNVQYAMADYGIEENSLPIEVLSQSSSAGDWDSTNLPNHGHQNSRDITCTIEVSDGSSCSQSIEISGKVMWCKGDNYIETCFNYNPCAGVGEMIP